ncbi:MAG: hypothetical protein MZV64_04180 [Ignavibacteriales bacterium]|nr:hypothetical protein [Ignavibacteriales bacterium]
MTRGCFIISYVPSAFYHRGHPFCSQGKGLVELGFIFVADADRVDIGHQRGFVVFFAEELLEALRNCSGYA